MQATRTNIRKLNDLLVAQIAAGEVIESPVAVLKELTENSIDAGASQIDIFLTDDGFSEIQVRDNGSGISREDLPLAIESFATSKISAVEDLQKISSMGFRGEALGSLRAVSRLSIESIVQGQANAFKIYSEPGSDPIIEPVALPNGTRILVKDLFFNVPVRREFISNRTKLRKQLVDQAEKIALAYPQIAFTLHINGHRVFQLTNVKNLSERINELFSQGLTNDLLPVYFREGPYQLSGYISKFYYFKSQASHQHLFVNSRPVHYKRLTGLLRFVYGELMPPGRFPVAFLFLKTDPAIIDINIHPQKREIKFLHEEEVHTFLTKAVLSAIEDKGILNASKLKRITSIENSFGENEAVAQNFEFLPQLSLQDESESSLVPAIPPAEGMHSVSPEKINIPQKYHARLFDTFVLASSDEGIFLIDQHTAHERINYEKFLKALEEKENISQPLLNGIQLNLSTSEIRVLKEHENSLREAGFMTESLGPAGYVLQAVPFYLHAGEEISAFTHALSLLETHEKLTTRELFDQMAKDLSCRHAVKKGETASLHDFDELVEKLRQCRQPLRCPHGRPTLVFLGKEDIFSLFKRRA